MTDAIVKRSKQQIFDELARVANTVPTPLYWLDTDGVNLGLNDITCIALGGVEMREKIVGKKHSDYYPEHIAKILDEHNRQVIECGKTLEFEEEVVSFGTNASKFCTSFRSPLRDDDGNIIGIVGTSIDFTDKKEKERLTRELELLQIENKSQQALMQEQEKFRKKADKVAHDIRSPLTSLLILSKTCAAIPERERIALREAATSINDIANNLLSSYPKNDEKPVNRDEALEPILISPVLLQLFTEKKYQYQSQAVNFEHNFSQIGEFLWVNIQPTAFKRTISNIINNAVDAFDEREGKVTLHLDADEQQVRVTIEDNGKGMSEELMQKIRNQIAVTEGKADGHGIGLTQVRETLENNQGQWQIASQVGVGTKITLTFPRTQPLNWIAETVQLHDNDTIVVLDDDRSIHLAWDLRFSKIMKDYPHLIVKHFSIGQDAVDFICGLNATQKENVFLLSDYELLEQKLNGLDVIEQTKMRRSILVTSHYANKQIQQSATKIGTKILPKQLASDVPIRVNPARGDSQPGVTNSDRIKMDAVFVDDEQYLLDTFKIFAEGKKVDTFQNPQDFLSKADQYHRDTKIMLDQTFANYEKKGMDIAEQLNAMGFSRLYLLSGENFSVIRFPSYVRPILKTDLEALETALNE